MPAAPAGTPRRRGTGPGRRPARKTGARDRSRPSRARRAGDDMSERPWVFGRYLAQTVHDHGSGDEQPEGLLGERDAYFGASDLSIYDCGGWDRWGWVGGLAERGGEG